MPRVRKCCVRECKNDSGKCNLFIWPKNEQIALIWRRNLGFDNLPIAPSNTFVCAAHFAENAMGAKKIEDWSCTHTKSW